MSVRPQTEQLVERHVLAGGVLDNIGDGEAEKIALEEKEEKFVRRLADPVLPSQEEVDKHFLMGHSLSI